ncbi:MULTISPECIES: DUF427 domain-containing protein [unclassified Roseitalea]|uniref:DUF427 domain-containing protein n=1 Tax=unclassified Roseitalea TaxID=2639107 RepID=UPI00273FE5EA|nr:MULTISPECIES: DUF427 domain-containing protein [unclassified Roseitalea]
MVDTTIRNPDTDAHFARIKPVGRRVRVHHRGRMLADSTDAIRVQESGHDIYDPVIYIPRSDATTSLDAVAGKSTHCPLKGDASYFGFEGEEIAWTYDRPLEGSQVLKGYLAFDPEKVTIEEIGANA